MNKKQAIDKWVGEMNSISGSLIRRAMKDNIDDWRELTTAVEGEEVYYDGEDRLVKEVNYARNETILEVDCEDEEVSTDDIKAVLYNDKKIKVKSIDSKEKIFVLGDEDNTKLKIEDVEVVYYENNKATVKKFNCKEEAFEVEVIGLVTDLYESRPEFDSSFTSWGTMWTFGSSLDEEWARKHPDIVSKCGFRIFEDDYTGDIYLGLDGGGYNFFDAHWTPLYDAVGIKWHTEE